MDVYRIEVPEAHGPVSLRSNPMRTGRVNFNVYTFQPWQALSMHRHPESDELFYIIDGRCLFYAGHEKRLIDHGNAVYVPAGTMHAALSCEGGATLISVQGPPPVTSIYSNLEFFCPSCGLETPLAEGAGTGDIEKCPRCRTALRISEAGAAFSAEPAEASAPGEARA